MNNLVKTSLVLTSMLLTACSSAPTDMEKIVEGHHEGETNVMPHDDNAKQMPKVMDDHHEGEENVQPHDDEPSAAKPPSRSNPVKDHDDTGTDPHGH